MVLLLNDEEFVEGVFGALGWALSRMYFREIFKMENFMIIGGVAWTCMWFTRKLGMRLYKGFKERYLNKDKKYGINIPNFTSLNDDMFRLLLLVCLYGLIYVLVIKDATVDDNLKPLSSTTNIILGMVIILSVVVFKK